MMLRFAVVAVSATAPVWLAVTLGGSFRGSNGLLRNPTGIAVDPSGAVYVANAGDSTIVVFGPGASGRIAPTRTIGGAGSGVIAPQGIALDSRGRIYATNQRRRIQGSGSVTVYAPDASGNAAPVRTIMGKRTQLTRPSGFSLGPDGKIYVANSRGVPVVFDTSANGDVEPERRLPSLREEGTSQFGFDGGDTDIAVGPNGSLLLADIRSVTVHLSGGWMRRYTVGNDQRGYGFWHALPRIATGAAGELYVAQRAPDSVRSDSRENNLRAFLLGPRSMAIVIYAPPDKGDTLPMRVVRLAGSDRATVTDLAVGRDGSLYVLLAIPASVQTFPPVVPRILVYSPRSAGDAPPVREIAGPQTGLASAMGIAVDRSGRIYVANNSVSKDSVVPIPSISVYAPDANGDVAPIRTLVGTATRLSSPNGVAVADDGTLYVLNADVPTDDQGSITVHSPAATGDARPERILVGPSSGLVDPRGLALGPGDTIYVVAGSTYYTGYEVSSGSGHKPRLNVYAPSAEAGTPPVRVMKGPVTDLGNPRAVAVDAAGQLYVADMRSASGANAYGPDLGGISVHRAGARDNEAPLRVIAGSETRLNGPGVPAVDRSGNLYVPNRWGTGRGSVTVYGPQADGDVRPLRTIAGPATRLRGPTAVALDLHDTLYVANTGTVTVYPPRANGDVAPVRTIEAR
jgi:sugar lactone lactonase YvrE